MRRRQVAVFAFLTFIGAECKTGPVVPTTTTDGGAAVDAGAVDAAGPASCATACAVFARWPKECARELDTTDGGLSCVDVCTTTPAYVGLPIACVSAATSLEDLRTRCKVCLLR